MSDYLRANMSKDTKWKCKTNKGERERVCKEEQKKSKLLEKKIFFFDKKK